MQQIFQIINRTEIMEVPTASSSILLSIVVCKIRYSSGCNSLKAFVSKNIITKPTTLSKQQNQPPKQHPKRCFQDMAIEAHAAELSCCCWCCSDAVQPTPQHQFTSQTDSETYHECNATYISNIPEPHARSKLHRADRNQTGTKHQFTSHHR